MTAIYSDRNIKLAYLEFWQSVIVEQYELGAECYQLSFMFNHMDRSERARIETMKKSLDAWYGWLANRCARKPWTEKGHARLFQMLAYYEYPVKKNQRPVYPEYAQNDGLHVQGVGYLPIGTDLGMPLDQLVTLKEREFIRRPVQRVHVQRITTTPDTAAEYNLKFLERQRFSIDDVLMFPEALGKSGRLARVERTMSA